MTELVQNSHAARDAVMVQEQREQRASKDDSGSNLRPRFTGEQSVKARGKRKQQERNSSPPQKRGLKTTHGSYYHQSGFGFFPAPWETEAVKSFFGQLFARVSRGLKPEEHHYLSFEPQLDPKGRLHGLSEHQRLELGGVEYRALQTLLYILVGYQIFWVSLGVLFLIPYSYRDSVKNVLHTSQPGNLTPGWWGFFNVVTEFANGGLNLVNANFIPFRSFHYILIVSGTLSLAGQTHFPIFLRLSIWIVHGVCPVQSRVRHTLAFLLQPSTAVLHLPVPKQGDLVSACYPIGN
jgi:hypothetical protein